MIFDNEHVKLHGCFIVWDGITQPEIAQGKNKYSLKVVVPPHCPDLQDMDNLANATLQSSPFKGVLPNGAGMPISFADQTSFDGGLYAGYIVLNCNTQRLPTVYDENGQVLDPMQYGPAIYGGQQVDVLVHCYHYDKAGNKGIATGLDAFSIIASANAPRQNFGGKGIDTSGAFGGGGGQPAQQGGFQQQQAPAQQGGFQQQQAPAQQGGAPVNNGQVYDQSQQQAPAQQGGFQQQQAPAQQGGFQQQQAPAQQGGFQQQQAPAQQGGFQQQQAPAQQGGFQQQQAPAQQGGAPQQSTAYLPANPQQGGGFQQQ